jgi:hypothetical protein
MKEIIAGIVVVIILIAIILFIIYWFNPLGFLKNLNPANWFKNTYGRGAGRAADKKSCDEFNPNYTDDGTSCWANSYGRGTGWPYTAWNSHEDCWNSDLAKELVNKYGYKKEDTCEWNGSIFYPKCKPGYKSVGCCMCEPDGGPGLKVDAFKRLKCREDEDLYGLLCYPKCKEGYYATGCCTCQKSDEKKE